MNETISHLVLEGNKQVDGWITFDLMQMVFMHMSLYRRSCPGAYLVSGIMNFSNMSHINIGL